MSFLFVSHETVDVNVLIFAAAFTSVRNNTHFERKLHYLLRERLRVEMFSGARMMC